MALAELIRFRILDKELTDNEFFNSFCRSMDRELREVIVSALYDHFKNNLEAAKRATKVQANVLNKQEIIPDQAFSYNCIDELPSELISECASWLAYKEYFHFAQCNRTIYYSCYSQPKIQQLDSNLLPYGNLHSMTLRPFKNIQNLSMEIETFEKLNISNKSTWINSVSLQTLSLFCTGCRIIQSSFASNKHLINSNTVRDLTLTDFSSADCVLKILSRFDQIDRLTMDDIGFSGWDKTARLQAFRSLVNLRNISISGESTSSAGAWHFISVFHNQLESLHWGHDTNSVLTGKKFPKLRSLTGVCWNNDLLYAFEGAQQLEKLDVYIDGIGSFDSLFQLVSNQKSLQQFSLECDFNSRNGSSVILEMIASLLLKHEIGTGMNEKLCIELSLEGFGTKKDKNDEFGLQIVRIMDALRMFKQDWKFTITYFTMVGNINVQLDRLDELKTNYSVTCKKSSHTLKVVVETR